MTILAAEVHQALLARRETVAVAESLTAGLVAAALTEPAGASATFRGGLVVYATDLKATLAGVSEALLADQGPVSPDVASALAAGVQERLAASYGLGVTGVAGPTRQHGVPVGTVYVGVAGPDSATHVRGLRLAGDRAEIRRQAVAATVRLLAERLSVLPESAD